MRVDPSDGDNGALDEAISNGHLPVVKRLLADARVDPSRELMITGLSRKATSRSWRLPAPGCALIRPSMRMGRYVPLATKATWMLSSGCLQIRRVDPSARDNTALRVAMINEHTEIAALLLADPRVCDTAGPSHVP